MAIAPEWPTSSAARARFHSKRPDCGCDVFASDLNPVACMLTWGAFHIVGGSPGEREKLEHERITLVEKVQANIDRIGIETDGCGWQAKVFLLLL